MNDTANRILKAAIEEFAELGYYGARINSIAKRANVNKERIYNYFGSKENLFIEVWNEVYNLNIEADKEFRYLINEDNIEDMGTIILEHYMEFHKKNPEFWKIYAWENVRQGVDNEAVKELKRPVYDYLENLYLIGQKKGIYKTGVSFQTFIFVLISIAFNFASNKSTIKHTLGLDFEKEILENTYIEEINNWFLKIK